MFLFLKKPSWYVLKIITMGNLDPLLESTEQLTVLFSYLVDNKLQKSKELIPRLDA